MKNGYDYTESGLTNVWLANGFTVRKAKYGEGLSIYDVDGLHRALARVLANQPHLTGTEVRFLRKEMGLSQRGLGELLGVSDQAVALWERKGWLPKTANRLLRPLKNKRPRRVRRGLLPTGNPQSMNLVPEPENLAAAGLRLLAPHRVERDWKRV